MTHRWDHHPPCRCGCGELADECAGPNPDHFGSMRIDAPQHVITIYLDKDDDE